jgi:hypothetical protein
MFLFSQGEGLIKCDATKIPNLWSVTTSKKKAPSTKKRPVLSGGERSFVSFAAFYRNSIRFGTLSGSQKNKPAPPFPYSNRANLQLSYLIPQHWQ